MTNTILKIPAIALLGILYWTDKVLAKTCRILRKAAYGLVKNCLPSQQVQNLVGGPSVAELVAKHIGENSTTVIDIGARWGAATSWWGIGPLSRIVGFDPDAEECAKLNQQVKDSKKEIYFPHALGPHRDTVKFYQTKQPGCSSIFEPDQQIAKRYPIMASELEVVRTGNINVIPLDDWWKEQERPEVSFIKLDVQGYELEVLKGAEETLKGCIGLELEVEFTGFYKGQPIFSDIDSFLRSRGFTLWSMHDLCGYQEHHSADVYRFDASQYGLGKFLSQPSGRLFWANAIYFRDYDALPLVAENQRTYFIFAAFFEAMGDFSASSVCLERAILCSPQSMDIADKQKLEAKFRRLRGEKIPRIPAPWSWYPRLAFGK